MVQVIDNSYISEINPDFIYNRFDLFCDNYIVLESERGQEKHILEARLFDNYAELGIWKMHISNDLLEEISHYLFQNYPNIGYTRFFFCNTDGKYKEVKHFSIDFPDSTESFLQRRSSKSRHRLNKQRHQAEREIGPISYKEYKREDCPEEIIRYYNIWKDRSHHIGKIEAESYFKRFHVTDIYILNFGGNPAAMMFSCEQCPIAYLENFSFDIQYSRYSPGQQIYEYVMTRLIDKQFKRVFLAGGDYEYKRYYGSIEETLYDGFLYRNLYQRIKHNLITYYYKHLYWKIINIKIMIKAIHNKIIRLRDIVEYHVFQERYPLLNFFYRQFGKGKDAKGVVLMLHRVSERINGHIPNNEHLKISPKLLEKAIIKYKKAGFLFLSLDQLYDVISGKIKINKPFVCFTMDDGYLDNYENAYPIFKKHHIPFAIFIATDFPDKRAVLWWYVIEDLILKSTEIQLSDGSKYTCQTFQEKWDTFRYIREKVLLLNQRNIVNELNELFANYNLDWYSPIQTLSMSWEQVKILTQEPLCTIGSHTVSHVALNKLSIEDMNNEIISGINIIKSRTNYKPEYFAYPYGSEKENGEREYRYIRDADIKMSFISYGGFISADSQLEKIPRFILK